MEGSIGSVSLKRTLGFVLVLFLALGFPAHDEAREERAGGEPDRTAQLKLRKTVKTRQFGESKVEGEERRVAPGDSLWRILIEEKGLPEKRFHRYLHPLKALNPRLKNVNVLRVGDVLFIPLRPDQILAMRIPSASRMAKAYEGAEPYRVKPGEFLTRILRRRLGLRRKEEVLGAFERVKDLNPEKKNWDLLYVGEAILLPSLREGEPPVIAKEPEKKDIGLDYGLNLPVGENLHLLEEMIRLVGSNMKREGEETFALKEGTVHIDRSLFPVIQNSASGEKVVLDVDQKIAPTIMEQLQSENPQLRVVPIDKESSLHEAANALFSRLGFQSLLADRPVVVQDGGVGMQVKGEWVVAKPEDSGARQEMWIISLTDQAGKTPDYFRDYLSLKGLNLKEILLPSPPAAADSGPLSPGNGTREAAIEVEIWPREKRELLKAFLGSYGVTYSEKHLVSLELGTGMRLNAALDLLFELGGRRYGVVFHAIGEQVSRALKTRLGIKPIVLELESLSSRQLLSRLIGALGDGGAYQEHRFPTTKAGAKDKLVLSVSGIYLPQRSMFLTDRTIPGELQRFFFEKGLRLVYFR